MSIQQIWQLVLGVGGIMIAIIGGLYAVVTRPLLLLLKSESALTRAELKADIASVRSDIKAEIASVRSDMKEMEHRLNQRIDTHLVHR